MSANGSASSESGSPFALYGGESFTLNIFQRPFRAAGCLGVLFEPLKVPDSAVVTDIGRRRGTRNTRDIIRLLPWLSSQKISKGNDK